MKILQNLYVYWLTYYYVTRPWSQPNALRWEDIHFFICYFPALWPSLRHHWGDSLTYSMLITAFISDLTRRSLRALWRRFLTKILKTFILKLYECFWYRKHICFLHERFMCNLKDCRRNINLKISPNTYVEWFL